MKKIKGKIILTIGIILITISLFLMFYNRKWLFEIKIDNNLKNNLSEKIEIMSSDYHCNQYHEEKAKCIYYMESIKATEFLPKDEIYHLVLSSFKDAKPIEGIENIELDANDEKVIDGKYIATHYIESSIIEEKYKKNYGSVDEEILSSVNGFKVEPRVKYSYQDNVFYISYIIDGEEIHSTLSENIKYEVNGNEIIVYRAVVYLANENYDGTYQVYSNYNLDGDVIDEITTDELSSYKIDSKNATIYKFSFKVMLNGKYKFNGAEIVKNYN